MLLCGSAWTLESGLHSLASQTAGGWLEQTRRCATSQSTRGKNALTCCLYQRQSSAAITRAALDWRVQEDAAVS
jgi:hypothetical protein